MNHQRYLAQHDAVLLNRLAEHILRLDGKESDAAAQLLDIVAGAILLPTFRRDCVAMQAKVHYAPSASEQSRAITLVYPQEADPASGRVSVLTPIGLAFIGCKQDMQTEVALPSGRIEEMHILAIHHADTAAIESNTNDARVS